MVIKASIWSLPILVGLLVGGCGLFETRDPQKPGSTVDCGLPLTTGTPAVIFNIQSFYGRPASEVCYANLIDTSFTFHPDAQDSSLFLPEIPFVGWDYNVELSVNSRVASTQDYIQVFFTSQYASAIISPDQNTELRFWNYQVRVRDDSLLVANDTLRFTGKADLTLQRGSNGEWKLTNWIDHRGGATPDSTWGRLRGIYRIGS
jgi:hypothetical protein